MVSMAMIYLILGSSVNDKGVSDGIMNHDSTEYYSHTLAYAVNKENMTDWILVTRSSNGK